jgi:hypothetical protein
MPHPEPYRVEVAGIVERDLEAVRARAEAAGLEDRFLAALDQAYFTLRTYPQHGEPLRDLRQEGQIVYTSRILVVAPLLFEYVLDELKRQVIIATPVRILPNSGF